MSEPGFNMATGNRVHGLAVRKDDLYQTPPEAVRALLSVEPVPLTVWEPCCGPGAIVKELRASGRAVVATDLVDYGCEDSEARRDFLMEQSAPKGVPAIVTNPPFKLADEFVAHAITLVPEVYMLMRVAFLEGLRWYDHGHSNCKGLGRHLSRVWVFAPRLDMMHRADWTGPKANSGMAFAWFVFMRDSRKIRGQARHRMAEPERLHCPCGAFLSKRYRGPGRHKQYCDECIRVRRNSRERDRYRRLRHVELRKEGSDFENEQARHSTPGDSPQDESG